MKTASRRKRLTGPDWSKACGMYGGKLRDVPAPHVRMFPRPDGGKRKVEVTFSSWVGFGGRHVYATLQEEKNPVWDGTRDPLTRTITGWRECWDDSEGRGQFLTKRFDNKVFAEKWVRRVFKAVFRPDTHELVDGLSHEPFVYGREGD